MCGDRTRPTWGSRESSGLARPLACLALALGIGVLGGAGSASAQVFTIVDEAGVTHYTNRPCDPQYVRYVPVELCAPPVAPSAAAEAPPVAPASPSDDLAATIESIATRHGVDARLVEAVVRVESGGNPRAVSPKGALGLMQLMPTRATLLGVADVFDPRANLDGGVRHLRDLLARYAGNVHLALAAYNAGEEAVRRYGGIPPYRETQEYVRKVLALYSPVVSPKAPPSGPAARLRL